MHVIFTASYPWFKMTPSTVLVWVTQTTLTSYSFNLDTNQICQILLLSVETLNTLFITIIAENVYYSTFPTLSYDTKCNSWILTWSVKSCCRAWGEAGYTRTSFSLIVSEGNPLQPTDATTSPTFSARHWMAFFHFYP